jgi:hypothetical protein
VQLPRPLRKQFRSQLPKHFEASEDTDYRYNSKDDLVKISDKYPYVVESRRQKGSI